MVNLIIMTEFRWWDSNADRGLKQNGQTNFHNGSWGTVTYAGASTPSGPGSTLFTQSFKQNI